MFISVLRELCNHQHNIVLEHFHLHKIKPHTHWQLSFIPLLVLNLIFPPSVILATENDAIFLIKI